MKLSNKVSSICLSALFSWAIASTPLQANEAVSSQQLQTLYQQGVGALRAGQIETAQQQFQHIVRLVPDNAQYRYALSVAHSKAGNYGAAWQQLRETLRLAPTHEGAQDDFISFWQLLDGKQLFNVGAAVERVRQVLGEPDQVIPNAMGEVWNYAFMSISFTNGKVFGTNDWRGLDRNHLRPLEKLDIAVDDQDWLINHRSANSVNVMTEYVVAPQVVQNWQELFSTQRLFNMAHQPLQQLVESMRQQTLQIDPDGYWNIIQENDDSILYEWRISASQAHPAQHEIARVMAGQRDVYRVAYAAKVTQLNDDQRRLWIQLLQQAELTPFTASSQISNQHKPVLTNR